MASWVGRIGLFGLVRLPGQDDAFQAPGRVEAGAGAGEQRQGAQGGSRCLRTSPSPTASALGRRRAGPRGRRGNETQAHFPCAGHPVPSSSQDRLQQLTLALLGALVLPVVLPREPLALY